MQQLPKELQDIINVMIAEGIGEDEIKQTIDWYVSSKNPTATLPPQAPPTKGNTSFVPGKDKTVLEAMGEGAAGWLKGAINLPKTIAGGIESLLNPMDALASIPEGISSMWDTAKQAGSNPDAFGQMMGEMGGQPLLTAGLARGVSPTLRGVGGVMEKHQPVSGMMPRLMEPRSMRSLERGIGGGLRKIGERMAPKPAPLPSPNTVGSGVPQINPALLREVSNQGTINVPDDIFAKPISNVSGGPSNVNMGIPSNTGTINIPGDNFARPVTNMTGGAANIDIPPTSPFGSVNVPGDKFQPPVTNMTGGAANIDIPPTSPFGTINVPGEAPPIFAKPSMSGSGVPIANQSMDDMLASLGNSNVRVETLDWRNGRANNASGESAASGEAIGRTNELRKNKQNYVVYDKGGVKRIIGSDPGSQNYAVRPGESFGIEGPEGFQLLDDAGGKYPKVQKPSTSSTAPPQFLKTNIPPPTAAQYPIKPRNHVINVKISEGAKLAKAYQQGYKIDTSRPISDVGVIRLIRPLK